MNVPRVEWPDFVARFAWWQGEHVTLVGPTGCGKTTLQTALLPLRQFVCVLGTKPKDSTLDALIKTDGYKRVERWADIPPVIPGLHASRRVVLWPRFRSPADVYDQQLSLADGLREGFTAGGWTFGADELWYLCKRLHLAGLLETIWSQGRSVGVTLVGATQRPAWVPLMAYDQATHLFFWRDNDQANLRRISGLGGLDADAIRRTVAALPKHDVLYVNTRDGELAITRAPKKT